MSLTLAAPPVFLEEPVAQQTLNGSTPVFNCSAHADPTHSLRWEREGEVIAEFLSPNDSNNSVEAFARLTTELQVGVNVTINNNKYHLAGMGPYYGQLTIFDTVLSDTRNYTCIE